jgi:hypothetical protein
MATLLKHTVKPSGGDFTNLDAAIDHLAASHANFVTADVYGEIEISGTWSSADTAAVDITGLTLDATRYLSIYTDAANRATGPWSTSKYQLLPANANAMYIREDFVRVDGLQIGLSAVDSHVDCCIYIAAVNAGATIWLSNLLLKQAANDTYRCPCLAIEDADVTVHAWNIVAYGMGAVNNLLNSCVYIPLATTVNLYSSTIIGGKYGIYKAGVGTANVKNTYCGGTITEDFYRAAGVLAKTNCASEDQSADDTSGADETATNCVAAAVALNTDTFVNVTAGSEDFHLAADGLSPLEDAGVDTSGTAAPLNFTTDMDGDTITTWPIGVDFRYVAPATGMVNDIVMIFEC